MRQAVRAGPLVLVRPVPVATPVGYWASQSPFGSLGGDTGETSLRNPCRNMTLASESLGSKPGPLERRTRKPGEWKGLTQGRTAGGGELEGPERIGGGTGGGGRPSPAQGPSRQLIPELSSLKIMHHATWAAVVGEGGQVCAGGPRMSRASAGDKGRLQGDWGRGTVPLGHSTCPSVTPLSQGRWHSGSLQEPSPLLFTDLIPADQRLPPPPRQAGRRAGELHYLYWKRARLHGDFFLMPLKRKLGRRSPRCLPGAQVPWEGFQGQRPGLPTRPLSRPEPPVHYRPEPRVLM